MTGKRGTFAISHIAKMGNVCHKTWWEMSASDSFCQENSNTTAGSTYFINHKVFPLSTQEGSLLS